MKLSAALRLARRRRGRVVREGKADRRNMVQRLRRAPVRPEPGQRGRGRPGRARARQWAPGSAIASRTGRPGCGRHGRWRSHAGAPRRRAIDRRGIRRRKQPHSYHQMKAELNSKFCGRADATVNIDSIAAMARGMPMARWIRDIDFQSVVEGQRITPYTCPGHLWAKLVKAYTRRFRRQRTRQCRR